MKNSAASLSLGQILENTAERWPDSPSITYGDITFTWRDTAERCRRIANALAQQGVREGERVAYLGFNSHRYFEIFFRRR